MSNEDFFKKLARNLKDRNNPTDLKPSIIGKVVQLNPIVVQIESERILLTENDELILSEWFVFRCNIDKTGALSSSVGEKLSSSSEACSSAKSTTETHSYTGTDCQMPGAIKQLSNAINLTNNAVNAINTELLALKCILNIGDYVTIASLDETDKYILIDKV